MIRTQIYLSEEQNLALKALAATSGKKQSVLIREAVDLLLQENDALSRNWKRTLRETRGIWADDAAAEARLQNIRDEFDRAGDD